MSGLVLLLCLLIGSISCYPSKRQTGEQDWPFYYQGSNAGSSSSGTGGSTSSGVYGGDSSHLYVPPQTQVQFPQGGGGGGQQQDVIIGQPDDGQFWTDVSDLEPVYALDSRSRYQRGRVVFAQTRYTPTEYGYPDGHYYHSDGGKGGHKV